MPLVKMTDLKQRDNPVPQGTYNLRVHKATYVPVPKNRAASPYISTWLMITGPDEQYIGRVVFANYPISGNGDFRLRELLAVTGHDDDFELESADQLLDLQFSALVGVQTNDVYPDKNVVIKHFASFV